MEQDQAVKFLLFCIGLICATIVLMWLLYGIRRTVILRRKEETTLEREIALQKKAEMDINQEPRKWTREETVVASYIKWCGLKSEDTLYEAIALTMKRPVSAIKAKIKKLDTIYQTKLDAKVQEDFYHEASNKEFMFEKAIAAIAATNF